jgi:hypothetical protein
MAKKKTVLSQIWIEFRIPLAFAVAWTILNIFYPAKDNSIITNIKTFGPAFFLISYFSGQFFRVKKQIKVEENLESVEGRLINLTERLEAKTNELVNYVTGGDSYFFYRVEQQLGPGEWFIITPEFIGEFPINNLRVTFLAKDSNLLAHSFELKNIQKKTPSRATQQLNLRFDSTGSYNSSIIFGADNRQWVQIINARKKATEVSIESEVYLNGEKKIEEAYIISVI